MLKGKYGAEGQNRTVDTSLFRAVLCQLSYLGTVGFSNREDWVQNFGLNVFFPILERCVAGSSRENQAKRLGYQSWIFSPIPWRVPNFITRITLDGIF